ncbi:sensor histidine kinase [Streptomyces oceani]|uniref:sensor histidine kinase n=1 Tax=Streptomyces oceani TaxID=1075402 RepID=UPI003B849926
MPFVTTFPGTARIPRIRDWLRAHPETADALLALVAFGLVLFGAATEPHTPDGRPQFGGREVNSQTVLLAALGCGSLVLRRRMPLPVLCLTTFVTVLGLVTDPATDTPSSSRAPLAMASVIALYTVCARTDRTTSWRVGAISAAVVATAGMLFGAHPWYAQENLGIFAWTGLAAAAGDAVRSRRAYVDAIRERAERAERTREEEARRQVAEERMRIARELHDVVAHHIALVNVQAGVASRVLDRQPDQAKRALAHVREESRHALGELQSTVGLLRRSGDPASPTEPAPGLGMLGELLAGFRRAGLTVELTDTTAGRALPSAVDLTAYRVVQEALTNVQKHVGVGARVQVRIGQRADGLFVRVRDDGAGGGGTDGAGGEEAARPAAVGAADTGSGLGLLGMRERVTAVQGSCVAGPSPDGGFDVRVWLPASAGGTERGAVTPARSTRDGAPGRGADDRGADEQVTDTEGTR